MVDPVATVEEYAAALAPPGAAHLSEFRSLVARMVPGVEESIRYDMPVFSVGDEYLVHVGAWKAHLGMYPVPRFERALEGVVEPLRSAKDTVKLVYSKPFPHDVVAQIIASIVHQKVPGRLPKIGAPATRALARAEITSLEQLDGRSAADVAALHGMGPKAVRILDEALAAGGMRFT